MKTIWFIRHGESQSNAGLKSSSASQTSLTSLGHQQATILPAAITRQPDLIVTSEYIRTLQTAKFVFEKYPDVEHAVWPVHEYTYLNADKYRNTTSQERTAWAEEYWKSADPDYVDGSQAESFNQLLLRAQNMLELIINSKADFITVFSHGWFIRALLWQQQRDSSIPMKFKAAQLHKLQVLKRKKLFSTRRLWVAKTFQPKKYMWHFLYFS
ncbi:MAG: phosphoglycerate mutase family protein, partial [Chloroflexota bacterium]